MLRKPELAENSGAGPRRRRVVFVTPGFSASEEDWCIPILRDFAGGLAERDDLSIVALRYPGEARRYRVDGIDVMSLGGGQRKGLSKIGLMGRAVAAVTREVRRRSADVIHAFWAHEPGAVASVAGRITGVPVVVTLMGGELAALPEIDYGGLLAPGNRMLARFALSRADRVIALSRILHAAAESRVEAPRLCRLDLGVRTDRFRPRTGRTLNTGRSAIRFLAVGALVPVKGHEVLLQAFARCHRKLPQTSLDLVGDGPLRDALQQQVRRLGIRSAVRFVGAVDHSKIGEYFDNADVLVLASWWEGAPQVAHEALASGLPIIGTAVGILPELSDAARWVPVGDAEALSREMAQVAASAETRARMAAAAVAVTRPIDGCIADHDRLYDAIIRDRPQTTDKDRDG